VGAQEEEEEEEEEEDLSEHWACEAAHDAEGRHTPTPIQS